MKQTFWLEAIDNLSDAYMIFAVVSVSVCICVAFGTTIYLWFSDRNTK